ncbi:MAG: hypothetical protein A2896_02075 [Candidatus Nealsonbacteria bacterium RIFCSPLOWO2_01_FULL_43_32]|uniref:UDP-N-acetylmuramate--L-alanine ligase n=1 Tax=Candidatus Nealsonbacteria bacterium RIFCSPLOWO2_01_FULL_43_32 TaxID=1801672 RepID=A0A1G2EGG6_9BACT|nr:MAG: hypothetical protein A2896_02075 [Candidatus Nealsonbacteria bacterium RIFCSPLOWO2_01_FULL_43_32]
MPTQKIKVHFIGIGGIGISALAQYYLAQGLQVSGSDLVSSEITKSLEKMGIKISIGKNVFKKDADLTIYSPAVNVRRRTSNILSYPEALGNLTKKHFTIAVCGTHGKSTTTAMLSLILIKAGFDPTVIVGTKVKEFGDSNFRLGKSRYLVIEACEYDESFMNYEPKIIVITNIEAEHLDYFKTFQNVLKAFRQFAKKLPKDGILIDEKKYKKTREASNLRKILKVPGEYNVANALAALAAARALKIPDKTSYQALADYQGSWRRFEERELKIGNCKLKIVSDYGHHPTQIKATLRAARDKWPHRQIWCVFQPHQYQRTYYLFNDFVRVFKEAPVDRLIITDIYDVAGREETKIKKQVRAEKLISSINQKWANFVAKNDIIDYLKKYLKGGEVVIFMGAGDIYGVDKKFV